MLEINLDELLNRVLTDVDEVPVVPPHKRCTNHSRNLVASSDALAAQEDKAYQHSYDRAMPNV